jgi:Fur family iron response transcriptional regulator
MSTVIDRLRNSGIKPTPQRIAVAEFVLHTAVHPTAHEVWKHVRNRCPTTSRATVYNTLNLFAKKGLLKPQPIIEGVVVYDPHVKPHHHFIDEDTGKVIDVPWEALRVRGEKSLEGFEVREYQVVMRGRRRK